jgi:hypothetical protein
VGQTLFFTTLSRSLFPALGAAPFGRQTPRVDFFWLEVFKLRRFKA